MAIKYKDPPNLKVTAPGALSAGFGGASGSGQDRHQTTRRFTILLVDDEQMILNALKRLLGKDYELKTARNKNEAIKIYLEERIDVVLTDLRMSGRESREGIELFTEIRKINPNAVVIILSGNFDDAERIEFLESGVFAVVDKPFEIGEFKTLVRNACAFAETNRAPIAEGPVGTVPDK